MKHCWRDTLTRAIDRELKRAPKIRAGYRIGAFRPTHAGPQHAIAWWGPALLRLHGDARLRMLAIGCWAAGVRPNPVVLCASLMT